MIINIEKLKEDLKNELLGAFYGGHFGGPLIESFQIDNMDEEQLIKLALRYGKNLEDYQIDEENKNLRK